MKLLIILLMLLPQTNSCTRQDQSMIPLTVVSQKKFRNRGHHPENNRKVIFRLVNNSDVPLIVYGINGEGYFDPTGYLMRLDKKSGQWLYPNSDNRPFTWNVVGNIERDKYILSPGKAITFVAEMSEFEVGRHFRRIIYAAYNKNDAPCEIIGGEFVLK